MAQPPPVIGQIVERKPSSPFSAPKPSSSGRTGFPEVAHRTKSAFSRHREEQKKFDAARTNEVPIVLPSSQPVSLPPGGPPNGDWREQISRENDERVAAMTEDEREEARREAIERFGPNVGDVLQRARLARARHQQENSPPAEEKTPVQAPKPLTFDEKRRLEQARSPFSPPPSDRDNEEWRAQMSKENAERVAAMTDEEREDARRQIVERFGANVGEILRRASLARTKQPLMIAPPALDMSMEGVNPVEVPIPVTDEERKPTERILSPPPSALASPMSTRPSSRADRQLRFAELEPEDVHLYESAPPSPKRRAIALPAPDPKSSSDATSLGKWKGKMVYNPIIPAPPESAQPKQPEPEEPEEGTPEYIRRKFFPFAPKDDPNLAWMDSQAGPPPESSSTSLRFDLHGIPIPPSVSERLPTYLGLHHHAEGTHAGYTLDDIFLLSRSTVPAQRATMLGVLARIAHRLEGLKRGRTEGLEELVGKEDELRKRILAAGIEAMSSKGNVGLRAIEVVWECIVGWDLEVMVLEGIELETPSDSAISTLPLEFFLPQVTTLLSQGGLPPETATQLLSILHRLAQQSNTIATSIVSTPKLLSTVLQVFLLTPVGQQESAPMPDPLAIQFLQTLTLSSRSNAQEIEKLADALLRFVVYSSFDSPYPPTLAINLLTSSLNLYRSLASYGLYCHVAGTAVEQLAHIEQYVISEACTSDALTIAWANLMEAWMVCATDPHKTTPPHAIKWSQVVAWNWYMGLSELQDRLEAKEKNWVMWRASWQAQAAWLEGCKINSIKGGETERVEFIESVQDEFERGRQREIVAAVLDKLQKELGSFRQGDVQQLKEIATCTGILTSLIRLWLACVPPHWEGPPTSPPFALPYDQFSALARGLLDLSLWSSLTSEQSPHAAVYCRDVSQFLVYYLLLSRRLPSTTQGSWLAQSFAVLLRLVPGDEEYGQLFVKEMTTLLSRTWAASQNIQVSPLIWERGGLVILEPFLVNAIRPVVDVYIGPLTMTTTSIKNSTSQRLPALSSLDKFGLPLNRDWTFIPFDHLLRSGDSAVFKSLPIGWDSSEVEVARSSLFFTKMVQEALLGSSMTSFVLTREEAIFGCMKVFMLEHGQPQNDSAEEVFRDGVVGRLMEEILRLYAAGSAESRLLAQTSQEDLEKVASRFLGPSVPFFQWYQDFVSLYDAISFSHSLFALLLIPPTSMKYAIDYRKHLWSDFNHIVKTIRISPEHVLSADVREYLYPLESDPQVIASYLGSLLKDNVQDFMKLVALHHIASNIWPDLRENAAGNEERASALLKAVVGQGGIDLLRAVVWYRQIQAGPVLLPPECFDVLSDVRSSRLDFVVRVGGVGMADRLQGLLNE